MEVWSFVSKNLNLPSLIIKNSKLTLQVNSVEKLHLHTVCRRCDLLKKNYNFSLIVLRSMSWLMLSVNEPDRQVEHYALCTKPLKMCRQVNGEKNGSSERLYHNKGAAIKIEWIERSNKNLISYMIWALSFVAHKKDRQFWTDYISITNVEALPSPPQSIRWNDSWTQLPLPWLCIVHSSCVFFVVFWLCRNKKCTHQIQRTNESQVLQRFPLSKRNGLVRSFVSTVVKANFLSHWRLLNSY